MPAVTTKFKDDDTLDLEMFAVNIKAQLDAGVNGIILGDILGEERKRILEIIETGIKNRPALPNYKELNTVVG